MTLEHRPQQVLVQTESGTARAVWLAGFPLVGDIIDIPVMSNPEGALMAYKVVQRRWLACRNEQQPCVCLRVEKFEAVSDSPYKRELMV